MKIDKKRFFSILGVILITLVLVVVNLEKVQSSVDAIVIGTYKAHALIPQ